MVLFDRIKFKFPLKYLKDFRKIYFSLRQELDPIRRHLLRERWYLTKDVFKDKTLGLNEIIIDPTDNYVIVEISGKILLSDYFRLLSESTIIQALNNINKTGIVLLDPKLLKVATVLSTDITRDLKVSRDLSDYVRDLSIYSALSNYRLKSYKSGIEVYSEARSNKERIILYSKFDELKSGKEVNKELQKYLSVESFKDILRIEANLGTFKLIRKYFNILKPGPIPLQTILKSDANPLLKYFNNMFPIIDAPDIPAIESRETFGKYVLERGLRSIIQYCQCDLKNCRRFVGSFMTKKGEPSYYMKDIKRVMAKIVSEKSSTALSTIEEIRKKLES